MYIDLLSIKGKYRGISSVSRGLEAMELTLTKKWRKYFKIYEKYMEWLSKMDNTYSDSVLQMLIELQDERTKRGALCEIILYSDKYEEFHLEREFLGYDPYWVEEGFSGIKDYNIINDYYSQKLNNNGLFTQYEDAQMFCDMWKKFIDENDQNTWVLETMPRPFFIWSLSK